MIQYLRDNWASLEPELVTHLTVVVITLAVATVIGVSLGIAASRSRLLSSLVLGLASAMITLPSFAVFGVLEIYFGLGDLPVEIGLVLYAQLPIVRNTAVALSGVDPAVLEAATGMGFRPLRRLLRIELPLALPLIIAGLRQATVAVVAIATVGAAVGSNNLGAPILAGIRGGGTYPVLAGVVPVALIGVLADALLGGAQRLLSRGRGTVPTATA
ncbi:MAG: ABC transporter permease [Candidatus Dormibacteria bacterium]